MMAVGNRQSCDCMHQISILSQSLQVAACQSIFGRRVVVGADLHGASVATGLCMVSLSGPWRKCRKGTVRGANDMGRCPWQLDQAYRDI